MNTLLSWLIFYGICTVLFGSCHHVKSRFLPDSFQPDMLPTSTESSQIGNKGTLVNLLNLMNYGKKTLGLNTETPEDLIQLVENKENSNNSISNIKKVLQNSRALQSAMSAHRMVALTGDEKNLQVATIIVQTSEPLISAAENRTGVEDIFELTLEKKLPPTGSEKSKVLETVHIIETDHVKLVPEHEFVSLLKKNKNKSHHHNSKKFHRGFHIVNERPKRYFYINPSIKDYRYEKNSDDLKYNTEEKEFIGNDDVSDYGVDTQLKNDDLKKRANQNYIKEQNPYAVKVTKTRESFLENLFNNEDSNPNVQSWINKPQNSWSVNHMKKRNHEPSSWKNLDSDFGSENFQRRKIQIFGGEDDYSEDAQLFEDPSLKDHELENDIASFQFPLLHKQKALDKEMDGLHHNNEEHWKRKENRFPKKKSTKNNSRKRYIYGDGSDSFEINEVNPMPGKKSRIFLTSDTPLTHNTSSDDRANLFLIKLALILWITFMLGFGLWLIYCNCHSKEKYQNRGLDVKVDFQRDNFDVQSKEKKYFQNLYPDDDYTGLLELEWQSENGKWGV